MTMRVVIAAIATLAGLGWAAPAAAQLPTPGRNAIAAALEAETATPAPGETVTLAITMTPDKGWHGYWQNPGDAGVETRVAWQLPPGLTAGPLRYPVPGRLMIAGLMNYVYEGRYALLVDVAVNPNLPPGARLPIRAKLDYLACTEEICVPERASVAIELTVGGAGELRRASRAFDRYREALPTPLGRPARFALSKGSLRLAIPFPASASIADPYFFPLTHGAIDYAAPQQISRNGDALIVEARAEGGIDGIGGLEGVLRLGGGRGLAMSATPGPVPAAGDPVGATSAVLPAQALVLPALLGALVGGLLLNVMPCVFPILSLKALSLARSGAREGAARRDALAYAGGAILTCLLLGAILLGLRAGGTAAGWAFQLQDPRVITVLLLLITAITLNLAGLFTLPALGLGDRFARSGGAAGSFWTGALAAFVATPCTGPFMGAALGAALILPAAAALAVFAGLGLGLALPFLLLGFVPALRLSLPRPGPWMARFRHWMAVPMALTGFGLAWILGRQTGSAGLVAALGAAGILGWSLWRFGRMPGSGRRWLPLAPAAVAGTAAILFAPTWTAPALAGPGGLLAGVPFSEARLAELRSTNRPVFVYFTADWCLTCKVNEAGALNRREVANAFAAADVAVLAADWTRGDAAIGRFLEKQGRSGVPLYLYYGPGRAPEALPQILTPGRLVALTEA
jgi:DsbC/DsbD-like thiol-disulfide interchange protein/cytochrome c biogenesis protein CcdA